MNPDPSVKKSVSDLLEIMAELRTPETGCPWDLEQTFGTIAPYTIEEAYEVADAIERNSMDELRDELGDLLFQVVYHARMAQEAGHFEFEDVVDSISRKMLRRHPHVFGTPEERARGAQTGFWERLKAQEKNTQQSAESDDTGARVHSILDDIPSTLPGLTRAVKLQKKAAKVGFDWPNLEPVFAKAREELDELERAAKLPNKEHIEEELGDLLFVVANLARHLDCDPETTARAANQKFIRRFRYIEETLASSGRSPEQSNLEEMDRLWNDAKNAEGKQTDDIRK